MRRDTMIGPIVSALSISSATVILAASPAFASTVSIPEPSALSIYGLATAGVVIAARFLRRK